MKPGDLILTPHLLETDDGKPVAAEWGRLFVPENRTKSETNTIEVPFIRLKSTAADPEPPIVYLAGGPGDDPLSSGKRFLSYALMFQKVADLVIVEPRGVGHSRPRLDCPGTYNLPLDRPLDNETLVRTIRAHLETGVQFWESQGVDLSGYNVREMAADINDLRQALGYDKISLFGGSFGSHHGLAVLRYHGEYVERAVLSGVEGPNHTIKLPGNIQRHLEGLNDLVKADPELSGHIPDFLGTMTNVLDRLEKEPETVEVNDPRFPDREEKSAVTVGKLDLQRATADELGNTAALRALPARYYDMAREDFSWLAEGEIRNRLGGKFRLMPPAVDCASGASVERRAVIEHEAKEAILEKCYQRCSFRALRYPGGSRSGG